MTPDAPEDDGLAELSGLLDGELPLDRALELQRRIAADPVLRAQWEALQRDDARWRAQAATATTAASRPLASAQPVPTAWVWLLMLVPALGCSRALPKLMTLTLPTALALNAVLLVAALVVVAAVVRRQPWLKALSPVAG